MASWGEYLEQDGWEEPDVDYLSADFDTLYRTELRSVVAVVYAACGNRWVAEDVAHDAFLATHRRWSEVANYDRPGAFVRRVALNLVRSRRRRLAAEAKALARYAAGQPPAVQALDPPDAEFWAAVRRLPRRQAEVIILRYLEDLSFGEIATILDCSEATVRVHAHRAREALACRLRAEEGQAP